MVMPQQVEAVQQRKADRLSVATPDVVLPAGTQARRRHCDGEEPIIATLTTSRPEKWGTEG